MLLKFLKFLYIVMTFGSINAIETTSAFKLTGKNVSKDTYIQEFILNNMDPSVDPCEDFHQYACGGALSKNKSTLSLETNHRIEELKQSIINDHPVASKYQTICEQHLQAPPRVPHVIKDTLKKLENSETVASIMTIIGTLIREAGVDSILHSVILRPVLLNNGTFASHLYFNLGFHLDSLETNDVFKTHVNDLIVQNEILSKEKVEEISSLIRENKPVLLQNKENHFRAIYDTEALPQRTMTDLINRYPTTIGILLQTSFSGINWNEVFVHHKVNEDSLIAMNNFLTTTDLSKIIEIFKFAIVDEVVQYQEQSYKSLSLKKIAKLCYDETILQFKNPINAAFKETVNPKVYEVAQTIADNIYKEIKLRLNKHDSSLDEFTRNAFEKQIDSMKTVIGAREMPGIQRKKQLKDTTTYIGMKLEVMGIDSSLRFDTIGNVQQHLDLIRTDFRNYAFYTSNLNEITVYSGKLLFPMFHVDYPLVMQYGILGMVVGHEYSHSFHPESTRFYKYGALQDEKWYSNQKSKDQFDQRVQCFLDSYSKLPITNNEGKHIKNVDAHVTLLESIAESGIQFAYSAFMKTRDTQDILGYTAEKLFFLSYAQGMCKPLPSTEEILSSKDTHNFSKERINGNLMINPNFAKAFQCSATSTMNPKQKCDWWGNQVDKARF